MMSENLNLKTYLLGNFVIGPSSIHCRLEYLCISNHDHPIEIDTVLCLLLGLLLLVYKQTISNNHIIVFILTKFTLHITRNKACDSQNDEVVIIYPEKKDEVLANIS